jgi:hypothetical protein
VPVAIWIYTLVFAFSTLWFAHYLLAALEKLRAEGPPPPPPERRFAPVELLEPAIDVEPMRPSPPSLPPLPPPLLK